MPRQRVPRRLAWRQLTRHRGSAALIMVLVALPVAAAMVASILMSSATPTASQRVAHDMGSFPAKLVPLDAADGTCLQSSPTFPVCEESDPEAAFTPSPAERLVPADAVWERSASREVRVGDLVLEAGVAVVDMSDERMAGSWVATSVPGDEEVLVTKDFLNTLQKQVGDEVIVAERRYRIAGTFRHHGGWLGGWGSKGSQMLVQPQHPIADGAQFSAALLTSVPDKATQDRWNRAGYGIITARALADDYSSDQSGAVATGLLVAMLVVYLVIGSIVGAAFTMSLRRRQRALALLRATGADARTLRSTVLWEGALLGLVGGTAGAVVGTAAGLALASWAVEEGFLGIQDVNLTWWHSLAFVVLTVSVTVLVAWVAARGVLRADALASLRGTQAASPRLRAPRVGLTLLALGLLLAWLAWWLASKSRSEHVDYAVTQAFYSALGSVVAIWVAALLLGGWLLQTLAERGSRWLALRMALREADRNRGRTLSTMAATASATVLTVLPLAALGYGNADMVNSYQPRQPHNVMIGSTDLGAGERALATGRQLADTVMGSESQAATYRLAAGGDAGSWQLTPLTEFNGNYSGQLALGSPELIRLALGRQDHAAERALAQGKVVVFQRIFIAGDQVELSHYPNDGEPTQRTLGGHFAGEVAGIPPLVTPERGAELGVVAEFATHLLRYPRDVTEADDERLSGLLRGTGSPVYYQTDTGPYPGYRRPMPYVAAVGTAVGLGIAVIGVSLAVHDGAATRMLLANLGARRRTLRGVVAVQSLYSVGFGVLAGATATLTPFLAIAVGFGGRWDLLPWGLIAAVVLVPVPLAAAIAAFITRPRPARVVAD